MAVAGVQHATVGLALDGKGMYHLNGDSAQGQEETMKSPLEFYDVKSRSKFTTTEWRIETKTSKGKLRYFAVAKAPAGTHEAWRIVTEEFAKSNQGEPA